MLRAALLLIACASAQAGATDSSRFQVKYRSIDRVYLEGGKAQGLYEGTILALEKGDTTTVQLRVVYASDNSASCEVLTGEDLIKRGDWLRVVEWGVKPETKAEETEDRPSKDYEPPATEDAIVSSRSRTEGSRTSGSVSLQWYSWQDNTPANFDFDQTTVRFNLRATDLGGHPWSLRLRTRGQYDQRNRAYSTGAPDNEFVNRLYEASLRYGDDDTSFEVQLGRLLPRQLARLGYIDGASVDFRPGTGWHTGLLAGAKPRWQFREEQMSIQKYGAYIGYEHGSFREIFLEQYIAFAGEYHGSEISREFVHLRGRLYTNSGWSISHQADIDFNRGWRLEKTDSRVEMSNLYFSARFRMNKRITIGATYDSRQNYWTYEQQSRADSLFDDELRRGIRGNLQLRLPYLFSLSSQLGYRDNAGDTDGTVSYSIYLSKSNIVTRQSRISARYSGFDGPINDGYSYSLRISQNAGRSVTLGAGYGAYSYTTQSIGQERISHWWEGDIRLDLPYFLFAHSRYQHSYGDDLDGNTLQLELGKRF